MLGKSFGQSCPKVYPFSYRDKRSGLPELVSLYCALLEYKGFAEPVVIVIQKKIVLFLKWGRTKPRSPLLRIFWKPFFNINEVLKCGEQEKESINLVRVG